MVKINIFEALVKYHLEKNLPNWLVHAEIKDGKVVSKYNRPLEEGLDENPNTKGFLVFENGDSIDRLKKDGVVRDRVVPDWSYIYTEDDFIDYINGVNLNNGRNSRESAYVVDGKKGRITRVREFNNNIMDDLIFADYLPRDFLVADGSINVDDHHGIGLKTKNAIRLAIHYPNVHTYQIKATPYSNAGIGIVAEYDSDGLVRTVHLEHRPDGLLPYVDDSFQIVAIEKFFNRDEDGRKVCTYQEIMNVGRGSKQLAGIEELLKAV